MIILSHLLCDTPPLEDTPPCDTPDELCLNWHSYHHQIGTPAYIVN